MILSISPRLLKTYKLHAFDFYALVIIVVASGFRIALNTLMWLPMNSDEGTMVLMAMHIEEHGDHPIFFWGQNYLGPIEAYVNAVLFRLFGASVWSARLGDILFFAGFLTCMYVLTSRLYSKSFALIMLALLGTGTEFVVTFQTTGSGYAALPFLCVFSFLIAYKIASDRFMRPFPRAILYLLWGVISGLALWSHLVTAPYLLVSGLLLVVLCWRQVLKWGMWCMLLGLIIGVWPLIFYNLHAAPGQNSLSVFLSMSQMGAQQQYTFNDQVVSALFVVLPATLGLFPQYYIDHLPFVSSTHSQASMVLQQIYGIGYVLSFLCALLLAFVSIGRILRNAERTSVQFIQQVARVFLLLGTALTLIIYAHNPASIYSGILGLRYILCTLVGLPAVLWPLWTNTPWRTTMPSAVKIVERAVRMSIVFVVLLVSLGATLSLPGLAPQAQAQQKHTIQLVTQLEQLHITRFYTDYWICTPLIVFSHEHLICGDTWVKHGTLIHGYDRYTPYRDTVMASGNPAFVYRIGMSQLTVLETWLKTSGTPYRRVVVGQYLIYQPAHPVPGLQLYR